MKDASFMKANAASKNIRELEIAIDSLSLANDSIGRNNWLNFMRTTYRGEIVLSERDSTYMITDNIYNINVDSIYNVSSRRSKMVWKRAALNKVKQLKMDYEINHKILHSLDKDLNKHKISWWDKFTLSIGCLIFFFIGAPLGAIVRKGGLGYPVLISVATFILYHIFNTSGYKMSREGEWYIWFGAWISTMVLAPLGIFFTYQSNKDSSLFNGDAIAAFFRTLFAIPEQRNIPMKEVIIEDPGYEKNSVILQEIHNEAREYKKTKKLKKLPSIKSVFFNENDTTLLNLNDKLESVIEELSNSKNRKIIIQLNEFPILSTNATSSPFKRKWLNILPLIVFPVGIFIYLRAIKLRIRLLKDLIKIEANTKNIITLLKKEKLIY